MRYILGKSETCRASEWQSQFLSSGSVDNGFEHDAKLDYKP